MNLWVARFIFLERGLPLSTREGCKRVPICQTLPAFGLMPAASRQWITKDTGRRARLYELTAAGKKQLGVEESRWQAVTSAVNRVLRMA